MLVLLERQMMDIKRKGEMGLAQGKGGCRQPFLSSFLPPFHLFGYHKSLEIRHYVLILCMRRQGFWLIDPDFYPHLSICILFTLSLHSPFTQQKISSSDFDLGTLAEDGLFVDPQPGLAPSARAALQSFLEDLLDHDAVLRPAIHHLATHRHDLNR